MFYRNRIVVVGMVCLGLNLVACNSERDVDVSGTVNAASGVTVGDKVVIDFTDLRDEGRIESPKASVTLAQLGDFEKTVALESDSLFVEAFDDRNGDGMCTEGEASASAFVKIVDDVAEPISLTLEDGECPATPG